MALIHEAMAHQTYHASKAKKMVPDLPGRVAELALYIDRLRVVLKARYIFDHLQKIMKSLLISQELIKSDSFILYPS